MSGSFNLTTEPWIPCERLDGTQVELSTRDVLAEAHTLRAIIDPSPLVVAVLHRHLLAVLHRVYDGPKTMKQWSEIAGAGQLDVGRIETYLDRVRDRMDLFHPARPFAQTRGLVERGMTVKAIDGLNVERSGWGKAQSLFQHRPPSHQPRMTPAQSVRALIAYHSYAMHGTVPGMNPKEGKRLGESHSASDGPLVHCAVVLLRRPLLFETLVANLLLYNPSMSRPVPASSDDRPSWEQPSLPARLDNGKEIVRVPYGWLDALTWLSRRIELERQHDAIVGFACGVGQVALKDTKFFDPQVTYRRDKHLGHVPIRIDVGCSFWRSANALFEATRGDSARCLRPHAVDLVCDPAARSVLGDAAEYTVDVLGQHAKSDFKRNVYTVRHEAITVVGRLFDDPDAREAVEHALRFAETATENLWSALLVFARHLLPQPESEKKEKVKERKDFARSTGAKPAAWSELGVAFDDFLRMLGDDMDVARSEFEARTRQVVRDCFADATASGDATGRFIKARALAEAELNKKLPRHSVLVRATGMSGPQTEETQP